MVHDAGLNTLEKILTKVWTSIWSGTRPKHHPPLEHLVLASLDLERIPRVSNATNLQVVTQRLITVPSTKRITIDEEGMRA